MKIALDTNILAYAEGFSRGQDDSSKRDRANRIIERFAPRLVVPTQVLAEFVSVCIKKASLPQDEIERRLRAWASLPAPPTELTDAFEALRLRRTRQMQWFDALIIAVAIRSGCTVLVTEDIPGAGDPLPIQIINPFLDAEDAVVRRIEQG